MEETLEAAKAFIKSGGGLLDRLLFQIAGLKKDEEENEDEIDKLQELHDNLEIAISRTEDIVPSLERK